jgi:hypothetical protein
MGLPALLSAVMIRAHRTQGSNGAPLWPGRSAAGAQRRSYRHFDSADPAGSIEATLQAMRAAILPQTINTVPTMR